MRDGFIKIAAATPDLHAADCAYNTAEIVKLAKEAAAKGAKLITFPEPVSYTHLTLPTIYSV